MIWLGIDTSHTPLAVAIVKDEQVLASISVLYENYSLDWDNASD